MKEFVLTQSYGTIEEMVNSSELDVCRDELKQGIIQEYAIVSRIGNRYDIYGNKIEGFTQNPYLICQCQSELNDVLLQDAVNCPICKIEENKEESEMKYPEIEALIDEIVKSAIEGVKLAHAEEIAKLKEDHAVELVKAKEEAKAELIAKLNA